MGWMDEVDPEAVRPVVRSLVAQVAQAEGRLTRLDDLASAIAFKGAPVEHSEDLARIEALPRRVLDVTARANADKWTALLSRENPHCDCVERWGFCITKLNPIQGHALEEAATLGGLLGPVGVGHGKTGIDILLPMAMGSKRAVLLIPPNLRAQFFERDYPQWSAHFKTPNLTGGTTFTAGRPVLTVIAYSELSLPKNSDILLRPPAIDLVVADEAHNLKDKKSARTKRFLRAIAQLSGVRFVALSGTITRKSLKDYGHLALHSLGKGSPLPIHPPTLDDWAAAIDAGDFPKPMGALGRLCESGDTVRDGFRKRLIQTPGVVATRESPVDCSLVVQGIYPVIPATVQNALEDVRHSARRPDGEESQSAMDVAEWCKQLACGFYYQWVYPRGEPAPVIDRWFKVRQAWNKEVREKLKYSREWMDSPKLLVKAAIRWFEGYTFTDEHGKRTTIPAHTKHGPLPTWESEHWREWHEVKKTVLPQTEAVWISDYLAEDAALWAKTHKGVIWYDFTTFGEKVALLANAPRYGGGEKASSEIIAEKGDRSIVASIAAHGTGKNLQIFNQCLVANAPSSGLTWEQMLGRLHRQGQASDEVSADVYLHTHELGDAFKSAVSQARYTQETQDVVQKLCLADLVDIQRTRR